MECIISTHANVIVYNPSVRMPMETVRSHLTIVEVIRGKIVYGVRIVHGGIV
jgi:hypothetical protein